MLRLLGSTVARAGREACSRGIHQVAGPSTTALQYQMDLDSSVETYRDRKTKIVCTLGPSSSTPAQISDLLVSGLDVARINCAHGDKAGYAKLVESVRAASREVMQSGLRSVDDLSRPDVGIAAVAFDIKGPEIRIGRFSPDIPSIHGSRQIALTRGERLLLVTDPSMADRSTKEAGIYVAYPLLAKHTRRGSRILIDDGNVELEVVETDVSKGTVIATVLTDQPLLERKGVNLPGVHVELPHVTRKDETDISTARELGADFLFASFVQSGEMVRQIRAVAGAGIGIISKIESQSGIDNIDSILAESDGIMVARGDLGSQLPPERVFLAQKRLIARANVAGKPVICATQMLESMTTHARPTRAECVDVASAVLDGADAVMLSGETAKGKYPAGAVQMMSRICQAAEAAFNHRPFFNAMTEIVDTAHINKRKGANGASNSPSDVAAAIEDGEHMTDADVETLASAAVHAAFEVNAGVIVAVTNTGKTAHLLSKYRPHCPILCATSDESVARQLQMYRGLHAVMVPREATIAECKRLALTAAKSHGIVDSGDRVVAVHGSNNLPGQSGIAITMTHVV